MDAQPSPPTPELRFQLFEFYEEAAQKAKSDAWTQTAWILTLSGAMLGYSMKTVVEHPEFAGLTTITWGCALGGIILCAYIAYVLHELSRHIQNYWSSANRIAATDSFLMNFIGSKEADHALKADYEGPEYPQFIVRLLFAPLLFAFGHVAWAAYVSLHLLPLLRES